MILQKELRPVGLVIGVAFENLVALVGHFNKGFRIRVFKFNTLSLNSVLDSSHSLI